LDHERILAATDFSINYLENFQMICYILQHNKTTAVN